jgi:hypothetical protein
VLRYLSDAFRAARQTIPAEARNDDLLDLIEWLGELVRQVDSSLLDEWEELAHPDAARHEAEAHAVLPPTPTNVTTNRRAFTVLVRNELFRRVRLAALDHVDELGELEAASASASGSAPGFTADHWADALDAYFEVHDAIGTGADARSAAMIMIDDSAAGSDGVWRVRQIFADPAGDHDWGISAEVDLAASIEQGTAVVRVTAVNQF